MSKATEIKKTGEEPNLKVKYLNEVLPELKKTFGFRNSLESPRLTRIVVNVGIGKINTNENAIKHILADLEKFTGQKPVVTLAKKAIAGFKLKEGDKVGVKVTLRGKRMWHFLERLVVATLPRIKDFQGISVKKFGNTGNLSLGLKEHFVFPEINPDETDFIFSLQVCISTTARNQEEGAFLLKKLGFPLNLNS